MQRKISFCAVLLYTVLAHKLWRSSLFLTKLEYYLRLYSILKVATSMRKGFRIAREA